MSDKIEGNKEEKSEDKKNIEMEEREQMLNAENKALEKAAEDGTGEEKKIKPDSKEGMETKPKKIPIGGIQMPGFFTRSKSKERCKDEGDGGEIEGTELIESEKKENKEETNTHQAKIKLPNPFRKSKLVNEEDGEKVTEPKEKKKLLDTIRLPLVNVFPRKKKDADQNLENQTAQAGLASMETLDDKSTDGKSGTELKNVALDDKNKDVERHDEPEATSCRQKLVTYRIAISALIVFIFLVIIIIIVATSSEGDAAQSLPIKNGKYVETITSCGKIEGMMEDSSFAFRGIPYARPPVGDLRFKYAQPLNNINYCWNDTFIAHNATDTCLQILSNGTVTGVEDCLTLDVVTPFVRYENPLPVIVMIGAESLIGGSPGKMRPSARYAKLQDVVFVRPNFRLGALGFLALEMLSQDSPTHTSGNYGLSDILEALNWVQLNIQHFGGDKNSVTLFGHRAGATLVTALATMKNSNKYFTRAWATSGGALFPKKSRTDAEIDNKSFLKAVGCQDLQCLLDMDAEKLVSSVEDTWRKPQPDLPSKTEDPEKRHEWLVLDGHILKEHPADVWTKEEDLPVKLVLGTTAHSAASEKLLMKHKEWKEDLVKRHVRESLLTEKNLTEEALKLYPNTYEGLTAMISDIRTVCPLFAISTQMHKVPFYVVIQTRKQQHLADIDSDVDAIVGRYEPKTPEQRRYVPTMQNFFYHYVWHGKIEEPDMIGQKVVVIGQDRTPNAAYSHCAFWINKNIVLQYAALD